MENILARLLFVMMSVFVAAGMIRSSFCDLAVECFTLDFCWRYLEMLLVMLVVCIRCGVVKLV